MPVFPVGSLGANALTVGVIGAVFTLSRFSRAFLVLRAQQAGFSGLALMLLWLGRE
ncbi:MAG: hypothetical protein ACXW0L_07365 [Methylosarcina sp.]